MTENSQGDQSKFVVFISIIFMAALSLYLAYLAYLGPNPESVFFFFRSELLTPIAGICALFCAFMSCLGIKRLVSM